MKIKSILFCFCLMNIALAESTQRYDRKNDPDADSFLNDQIKVHRILTASLFTALAYKNRNKRHLKNLEVHNIEVRQLEQKAVDRHQNSYEKFKHYSERLKEIESRLDQIKVEKASTDVDIKNARKLVDLENDKFSKDTLSKRTKIDQAYLSLVKLDAEVKSLEDTKFQLRKEMAEELKKSNMIEFPKSPKRPKLSKTIKVVAPLLLLQSAEAAYYTFETDHEIRAIPFAMIAEDISRAIEANKDCREFDDSQAPSQIATEVLKKYCSMIADSGRNDELTKNYNDTNEEIEIEEGKEASIN